MEEDTVVKMSLEGFCKAIDIDGKPLLDILREKALKMQDLVVEVYHLINLHFLDRCETFHRTALSIVNRLYAVDPRIEPTWNEDRVFAYFYAVARSEPGLFLSLIHI